MQGYEKGDVITFGFSTGGTGYGDPLDRDPDAIAQDLEKGTLSAWAAEHIYKVVWDAERRRIDRAATAERRQQEYQARLRRGKPYDVFEKEWQEKNRPQKC